VSAVFFGINTVDLLISLFMVHAVATLIIGVAIWLVGLGSIALLYSKESGLFYKQQSATARQ
jgi:4-hydroxybenzoate polyprenyltransferase